MKKDKFDKYQLFVDAYEVMVKKFDKQPSHIFIDYLYGALKIAIYESVKPEFFDLQIEKMFKNIKEDYPKYLKENDNHSSDDS